MKKTYINPEMEVVKIETQKMLAASVSIDGTIDSAADAEARDLEILFGEDAIFF